MTHAPRSVAICLVLILCFASVALADDFKTINGKEYKNATGTFQFVTATADKSRSGCGPRVVFRN
jgi:hypothetical protein